jgi:L,D-peptidoglycan transpeptidase YkuD (ErfK/YbiS/YcfS/YnhG family)
MSQGKILKTYKIALGGEPVGPKTRQGDHKTPEGVYVLVVETLTANSTGRFTSPIPMRRTGFWRKSSEFQRAAISTCMGFPMAIAG